jgi:hypothetical protein
MLVEHMIHVNPVKVKISEGKPDKIARRGNTDRSGNRFPHQATMHETGYEKW